MERKVAGLLAAENAVNLTSHVPVLLLEVRRIGHKPAKPRVLGVDRERGQTVRLCQLGDCFDVNEIDSLP